MQYRVRFESLNGLVIEHPLDSEDQWIRDFIREGEWNSPFEIDSLPHGLTNRVGKKYPLLLELFESLPVVKVKVWAIESHPKVQAP